MRRAFYLAAHILMLAADLMPAQSAFDVASVKRAVPGVGRLKGDPEGSLSISGESVNMRNVSLKDMITAAYGIKNHQLSGPAWLDSDRYDLIAKSASPITGDQVGLMLQGLLADRFKLEVHRQTKDLVVTAMTVGKNGTKLGLAKPEGPGSIGLEEQGKMVFRNYSMSRLADYLSRTSGDRPVVDATGIEGYYDFSVSVLDTPSNNLADVKRAIGMGTQDGTLAKRITEETGLRLDARRGPVEIIVVDHAEKSPAEN